MTPRTTQPRRIVLDTATGRVGEVMDETRTHPNGPVIGVYLRPVGGGYEWRTEPDAIRPYEPTTT